MKNFIIFTLAVIFSFTTIDVFAASTVKAKHPVTHKVVTKPVVKSKVVAKTLGPKPKATTPKALKPRQK